MYTSSTVVYDLPVLSQVHIHVPAECEATQATAAGIYSITTHTHTQLDRGTVMTDEPPPPTTHMTPNIDKNQLLAGCSAWCLAS